MEIKSVADLVQEAEKNDKNGTTTSSRYVSFSMRDDIDKTDAYINSKHISGDVDYLGREKPFFNIVIAARNIWYRATDIDQKNIVIRPEKQSDVVEAFLYNILLQEWMKKVGFGKFLNNWGLTLATHGSAITKFIKKGKELFCSVMDWNTMIVDPVDFKNNIKIQKIWYTPAQLKQNKLFNKEQVKQLINSQETRKTLDGQTVDQKASYIPVYEVHGMLSLAQYKMAKGEVPEDGDEDEYFEQMHVISYNLTNKDKYDNYTLYVGREAKDPYMISHLIEKEGQTYAGGAVKNLFEAQWMVNHTQKQIKDHLDLGSKIIFQTSDESFVGKNALTNIENGEVLMHADNKPLTRLADTPDTVAMQNFKTDWQAIAAQINGISEAMMGQNPPSGSAWRQTEALLQESHSLFELMTENKGLAIKDMMNEYILPSFEETLNNSEEIAAILEDYQIKQIDTMFLSSEVTRMMNEKKKKTILSGAIYDTTTEQADRAQAEQELKGLLQGNQRFIKPSDISSKTWKEVFDGKKFTLDIDVTGESKDYKGLMATLTTVLQTIAGNPTVLQDPNARLVFNKIISMSGGISPLEISVNQQAQQMSQPLPQLTQPAMAQP